MNGMHILVLFVQYGETKYPHAVADFRAIMATQLPECHYDMVVIDNALPTTYQEYKGDILYTGGDNSYWEFSAWDSALERLGEQIQGYDFVCLTTSALLALGAEHTQFLSTARLREAQKKECVLGKLDYAGEQLELNSLSFHSWLRTSLVFIAPRQLISVGELTVFRDKSRFFSGDASHPFLIHCGLNAALQTKIKTWLTDSDIGYHSSFSLTAESLGYFEEKTLAILNEYMLTLRLRTLGIGIVDLALCVNPNSEMADRSQESLGALSIYQKVDKINCDDKNIPVVLVSDMLEMERKVLDVGCSCGDNGVLLKEVNKAVLWGMEYDSASIEVAASKSIYEQIFQVDLNTFSTLSQPHFKNFFDAIFFGDVLEHLYQPLDVLQQFQSFLKPGACFFVSLPNIAHVDVLTELLNGSFTYQNYGLLDKTHIRFFTWQSIAALFTNAQLQVEQCTTTFNIINEMGLCDRSFTLPASFYTYFLSNPHFFVLQYICKAVPSTLPYADLLAHNRAQLYHAPEQNKWSWGLRGKIIYEQCQPSS